MINKDIKHDMKILLKDFNDIVKQNNKDLKNSNIRLDDYLVTIIDNAGFLLKKFTELKDNLE